MPEVNQKSKWDKDRKRLVVLLLAAAWITIAGYKSYSNYGADSYDITLANATGRALFQFFIHSLPAILFGGVFFWWFGKERYKGPPPSGP